MFNFNAISEPQCHVQNYYGPAYSAIEAIKKLISEFNGSTQIGVDDKLMVGSLIWEFLLSYLQDDYLMEDLMV